jgi:hypothetical protein
MTTSTTVADTVASVIPLLQPLAGVAMQLSRTDPETVARVQTAMNGVQAGVVALAASETAVQSKPIVDRILSDGMAVLQVAATLPLPPPYNIILMVASSLLPSVISAVDMLMKTHTTVPTAPGTATPFLVGVVGDTPTLQEGV